MEVRLFQLGILIKVLNLWVRSRWVKQVAHFAGVGKGFATRDHIVWHGVLCGCDQEA